MRKLFSKKKARPTKRTNGHRHDYNELEDRRVLAVLTALDALTGQLTINITGPNETAAVSIDSGLVVVNGNSDLDSSMGGTQSLNFEDLRSVLINGELNIVGQSVELLGDYSAANGAGIQTISISNVNSILIYGNYVLAGDFVATLDGAGGGINDGTSGRLFVGGTTNIDAGNNPIVLNNQFNDFVGPVSLATGDAGVSAWIHDANELEFSELMIVGNIDATAGGNITDTDDSNIMIEGVGSFTGASIAFGNNTTGTTQIFRVTLNTTGHAELYLDNAVMFYGVNSMGSLEVDTDQSILDGQKTAINIAGLATLRATEGIQLGDLPYDIFNAGALNFNSEGLVDIAENSSTQIAGVNTALSLNLHAFGDITDADDATINVDLIARFRANNVDIGDTEADEFNAGSIQFDVGGNMFLNEDSGTHIVESNHASRFELVANGPISDEVDAIIEVATLSHFEGSSITIGDSDTDSFVSGWITFKALNDCFISENDSTTILNLNMAETATIVSAGSIINGNLARIFVTGNASFSGSEITLGNKTDDNLQFGGLTLNAVGAATVFEDDATMFVGSSAAAELRMNAVANIIDATDASINVSGIAVFFSETGGIMLGDSETDIFNAGSLTIDAVNGVANITEDSDIFLTGFNQSRSLVLNAQGTISDDDFASIDLDFLLSVTGTDVELGDAATDFLGFGSLTANTIGNARISSQETIVLTGTSVVGGQLALTSEGSIFDSLSASTTADSAILTAINVVLGDSVSDCFDVLPADTLVVASGVVNITYGC